ncbi:glycosyltransferase [Bradyrhizobium sp. LHD-71]|uniref:glycosyltransferase n=1 Tax=Bradyrhizobium sp. LHD-71 TaxID=3072141 RepID=UPI00280CD410|nr:glycosyltransferase [Bradyrhizobium sp. LHD-71]MDQ8729363.1 glycosyltransferase [Bradyrhizobium sp. LHD-71]
MPDVAVVVAAYNAEATIREAVESVLSAKVDCVVYVVDDCSRVLANEVLHGLSDRIVFIRMEQNSGPAAARNAALELILQSDFKYVAILDADDISAPGRLEKQAAFLDAHPDVGACGSYMREFHEVTGETIRIFKRPAAPDDVRDIMFFNMGVNHASAMIRTDALRKVGLYSLDYKAAEDYELMRRIGTHYKLANIPECLVHYRISSRGQSHRLRRRQVYERMLVQLKYFEISQWRAWAGIARSFAAMIAPPRIMQAGEAARAARGSANELPLPR